MAAIVDLLDHDYRELINGLQQHNVFLIQKALPNLQQHIQLLDTIISQANAGNVDYTLLQVRNHLLQLVKTSKEILDSLDDGNSSKEGEDICSVATTAELDKELVLYIRKTGLPWAKIGKIFSLSRQAIYNFRKHNDIPEPNMNLNDVDLEAVLPGLMQEFPSAGAVTMRSILFAYGFKISIKRVKVAMKKIDPVAVFHRRRQKIHRRVYRVKGPNYLWHIDGTHKLVMFRFIIHGCVDGHSRQITFLECSTDNTAETVLQLFLEGVNEYGIPHRVRGDRGVENTSVANFMESGGGRGRFIPGPSVHNTRIERLWRDVNEQVSYHFKDIFLLLEDSGILDEHSLIDIFCLHYVFLPRIRYSLKVFMHGWNKHSIRTAQGKTPEQLWLIGMIKLGYAPRRNDPDLSRNYNQAHYCAIHFETFKLELGENIIAHLLIRSMLVLPDPTIDDYNEGVSHFAYLRNYLLSQQ